MEVLAQVSLLALPLHGPGDLSGAWRSCVNTSRRCVCNRFDTVKYSDFVTFPSFLLACVCLLLSSGGKKKKKDLSFCKNQNCFDVFCSVSKATFRRSRNTDVKHLLASVVLSYRCGSL